MKINKYYSVSYIGNGEFIAKRTKYPRFADKIKAENDKWVNVENIKSKSRELIQMMNKGQLPEVMKYTYELRDAASSYYCWLNLTKRRVYNLEINGKRLFTIVFPWWATKSEREKYFKKFVNI